MDLLSRIECRRAFTTAEKCRNWLNQLFRYALIRIAGLAHNPAADLDVVAVPKPPVEHNPFLRMEELPYFLGKLRAFRGSLQTQLGIRLLLLPVHRVESKAAPRSRSRCAADVMRALANELFPEWEQRLAQTKVRARSFPNSIVSVECVTGRPA